MRRKTGTSRQPWIPSVRAALPQTEPRSEEHTSELQSLRHLVCRLLLEKKKIILATPEHVHATTIARLVQLYTVRASGRREVGLAPPRLRVDVTIDALEAATDRYVNPA